MKFYESERQLFNFAKGNHTLKEWSDYGINKIVINDCNNPELDCTEYWDGLRDGEHEIDNEIANRVYELDYFDNDLDGYTVAYLKEVK